MSVDAQLASTKTHLRASLRVLERLRASLERTDDAIHKSREAVLESEALLSMREPRPQLLAAAEQDMERWRIATSIAQALQEAGYGCELSRPAERAS
jgi:hypothetical protein